MLLMLLRFWMLLQVTLLMLMLMLMSLPLLPFTRRMNLALCVFDREILGDI